MADAAAAATPPDFSFSDASAVAAATVFSPAIAWAQDTGQPIRLIVPYAPGGPIDVTARALAERVRDSLGTVIIDNKGGAAGTMGTELVARAAEMLERFHAEIRGATQIRVEAPSSFDAVDFHALPSIQGHDAFLVDFRRFGPAVARFMASLL